MYFFISKIKRDFACLRIQEVKGASPEVTTTADEEAVESGDEEVDEDFLLYNTTEVIRVN